MKWFVYLLRCSDNSLYCGITNNIENRIKVHESGKGSKYVKTRLPISLAYFEESENRSTASKRENAIKKLSKSEKEKLIKQ